MVKHIQICQLLQKSCWSVFDHFVGVGLKRLRHWKQLFRARKSVLKVNCWISTPESYFRPSFHCTKCKVFIKNLFSRLSFLPDNVFDLPENIIKLNISCPLIRARTSVYHGVKISIFKCFQGDQKGTLKSNIFFSQLLEECKVLSETQTDIVKFLEDQLILSKQILEQSMPDDRPE